MVFFEKMQEIKRELESKGHHVVAPVFSKEEIATGADTFMDYVNEQGGVDKVLPDDAIWKIKEKAMLEYKTLMDNAEALLVCNFDKGEKKNRIGDNTFMEMGYMFFTGKKIYVLQGPPYGDDKIEEVLGMRPTFLKGDLGKME